MQVRDLQDKAVGGKDGFVARFPHAFLVLLGSPEAPETSDFYTTLQTNGEELRKLVEIASGSRLCKDACVYPVVRRSNRSSEAGMVTIGRTENCDIWLPFSGVSKFHCYISKNLRIPNQYQICDGGSSNGTKLDDKILEPHRPVEIRSGEMIQLGEHVFLRFFPPWDMWQLIDKHF